jgi:hypothetical protein
MDGESKKFLDAEEVKYGEDIVLLAGAGASCYIGLDSLDMMLKNPGLFDDGTEEGRLIKEIIVDIEALRIRNAVFEEIIGRLREYQEIAFKLRTDYLFSREIGHLPNDIITGFFELKWKKALTECYRKLIDSYGPQKVDKNLEEYQTTLYFLEELAKVNSGYLHVYTTNYDCSYQVFASELNNLSFVTHINNTDGRFGERWYIANVNRQDPAFFRIFTHRLHGCVAWFHDTRNPYLIEEQYGAGDNLEINDDEKLHRMAIKLVTSQVIGINPAFLLFFSELAYHLRTAKALIIWGYSFRDLEVLRAINNAFYMRNTPLPIYSLNPFLGENGIIDNIRRTLRDAPVEISPHFKPRKIDWRPDDGNKKLVERTIDILKKEVLLNGKK